MPKKSNNNAPGSLSTTTSSTTNDVKYIPVIDGLRGIAIGLVLWWHEPHLLASGIHLPGEGWMGVDLFFSVSGFLITSILLDSKAKNEPLKYFWFRRSLRIFPLAFLYLSLLLAAAIVKLYLLPDMSGFSGWLAYFTYVGNFHTAAHGWPPEQLGILWSLAIEEQFYILWPFAVRYLSSKRLLTLCGIIAISAPCTRYLTYLIAGWPAVHVATPGRLDGLVLGAVCAILMRDPKICPGFITLLKRLTPALLAIAITLFFTPFGPCQTSSTGIWQIIVGYSGIAFSFGLLVAAALVSGWPIRIILENSFLVWLGKHCYGIYIWHIVTGQTVHTIFSHRLPEWIQLIIWLTLTLCIAALSFRFYEKLFLRLAHRFRTMAPATTPSKGVSSP